MNYNYQQLEQPIKPIDPRHKMVKQKMPILVPKYNRLYDSLRTEQGWRYISDNYAKGTFTTIAATPVVTPVNLGQVPNWRTSQWPGAVQVYLLMRMFSQAPQTATFATQGNIDTVFVDKDGNTVPLGVFLNNAQANIGYDTLLLSPVSDPGETNVGNLVSTLNAGATVGTYNWQIGFSAAYLTPSIEGYKIEYKHPLMEE